MTMGGVRRQRRPPDPTRVRKGGSEAWCTVCGEVSPLPIPPVPLQVWTAAAKAFVQLHRGCAKKEQP